MTDNEITREKTFSEELPYFKEQMQEVFDNYHNPNGSEDPLYIAVLRHSSRIIRKAEEEITRQQVEIERLEKVLNGQDQLVNALNKCYKQAKSEAVKEFARRLKCGVPQETGVIRCSDVDNLIKEMVGRKE